MVLIGLHQWDGVIDGPWKTKGKHYSSKVGDAHEDHGNGYGIIMGKDGSPLGCWGWIVIIIRRGDQGGFPMEIIGLVVKSVNIML